MCAAALLAPNEIQALIADLKLQVASEMTRADVAADTEKGGRPSATDSSRVSSPAPGRGAGMNRRAEMQVKASGVPAHGGDEPIAR